jgi:signal transduction histidine kinase
MTGNPQVHLGPHPRMVREETRLTIVAAVAIIGIGALAAINLFVLNNLYWRSVRASAAQEVAQLGSRLASRISDLPVVGSANPEEKEWRDFTRIIRIFDKFVPSLAYVSVHEDNVILFQESASSMKDRITPVSHVRLVADPRIERKLVMLEGSYVPVMTFSVDLATAEGKKRTVEVALKREAIAEEESGSRTALFHMFRTSLSTIAVGFIASVLLVGWLIRRELRRTHLRRQQENLAFAGAMATGIIHDFRNPMSALRLDLQMLDKEVLKGTKASFDRVEELSGRARGTLDRLDDILKEFQHLARPEQESFSPVDLNACIRDCMSLLSSRFSRAGVSMKMELTHDSLQVLASETGLKRALLNILVNAEQASPRGGTVCVQSRVLKGHAWVEVSDQGTGIPESKRQKVFDLFVSTKPGGFGLGLPLAKAAIQSFGGGITVSDSSNGGALFLIRIPLIQSKSDGSTHVSKRI